MTLLLAANMHGQRLLRGDLSAPAPLAEVERELAAFAAGVRLPGDSPKPAA